MSARICVSVSRCHYSSCTVRRSSLSQPSLGGVMVTPWAGRPAPQPSTLKFTPTDASQVPIRVGNQPNVNDCGRKPQDPTKTPSEHATFPTSTHPHTHTHSTCVLVPLRHHAAHICLKFISTWEKCGVGNQTCRHVAGS